MLLELREILKGEKTGFYLKELLVNGRMSKPEIENFQKNKLKELLQYVLHTNKYYQLLFEKNKVSFQDIDNWDLNRILNFLPIIDKSLIKENKEFWLDKSQTTFRLTTSGSTGQPFEIFHSRKSSEIKYASKERSLKRLGIGRTEKQLYYGCGYNNLMQKSIQKLNSYIHNSIILNKVIVDIRFINAKNISQEIKRINKLKPSTIWGYPSFIFELARYIVDNNIQLQNKKLKAVITSGESFSNFQRDIILSAFKVPIIDEYNSNEGFLGSTCKHGKLHINEDTCIMRVLDKDGKLLEFGQGQLVVTQLYSHAYPLINYIQGDTVDISHDSCSCGLSFRVLNKVEGRSGSQQIRNGHNSVSHAIFSHMITKSPFFRYLDRYQLIQNQSGLVFKVQESLDSKLNRSELEDFVKNLFEQEKITFEYVDEIQREKSGKYKDFIIQ